MGLGEDDDDRGTFITPDYFFSMRLRRIEEMKKDDSFKSSFPWTPRFFSLTKRVEVCDFES